VILALALGIGANSAMFSVVNALLLHPVDYKDPSRLVFLWEHDAQGVQRRVAAANFLDWRAQSRSFSAIAAWAPASYVITGTDHPQQIGGAMVTANLFDTLGVQPVLGRTFRPDEDGVEHAGSAARVAVISYQLWQERFGSQKNVLGKVIELDAAPYTIVGVLPPDFQFLAPRQIWVPASIDPTDRDYRYLFAVARVRGSRASAQAEMSTLARTLAQEYPKSDTGWTIEVQDLLDWLVNRSFRTRLLLLFGAVGMVLLITCTNVAGLLLTRSIARSREIAVRVALGATQSRLIRQMLTESLLLGLIGGAAGLGVAWNLIRIAPSIVPPNAIPATVPIQLNAAVVWFTLGLSVLTSLIFGLAPALSGMRLDVQESLKDGGRGSTMGRRRQQFRQAMVALQVAVALMLLISATLMRESLNKLNQTDPGFDMNRVLTVRLFLPAASYTTARTLAFRRQAIERLRALPGVESVTAGSSLPLLNITMAVPFDLETGPQRSESERPGVGYTTVSPGYFAALRIPLRFGRVFSETDSEKAPPVVIVNEAFVERYFPGENPVGKRILLNRPILGKTGFEETVRPEIVGVASNVRFGTDTPDPSPMVYAPDAQNIFSTYTWLAVRSSSDPVTISSAVRQTLLQMDGSQPVDQISSLEQIFSNRFSEPKFQASMMNAFAVLALLLAVIGIYGVNAYAVAQRRHEIGVRMALGATPGAVLRSTIASGMQLTVIGIAAGLLGAIAAASLLRSVLVGVSPTDPLTLAAVALVLALVSLIACYLPAHRAMSIDPAAALRQE
jgi:predicted permease